MAVKTRKTSKQSKSLTKVISQKLINSHINKLRASSIKKKRPIRKPSPKIGTRQQVWNGTKLKTSGGLTKSMLKVSTGKKGCIVSKAVSEASQKRACFQVFSDFAKKQKGKKFVPSPKKGTLLHKDLMEKCKYMNYNQNNIPLAVLKKRSSRNTEIF